MTRGIPTKAGGLQDPNADFNEIFETLESIPNVPKKIVDGFLSWAKGEQVRGTAGDGKMRSSLTPPHPQDPDWGKAPKKDLPKRPW